jgi:CheY-like chemotaxis protein
VRRRRILIIDPIKDLYKDLSHSLIARRYSITFGHNSRRGLALACELLPELIIISKELPNKDGLVFVKDLRSLKDFQNTPIIVTSNDVNPAMIKDAILSGANDFLLKPFSTDVILKRFEKWLGNETENDAGEPNEDELNDANEGSEEEYLK